MTWTRPAHIVLMTLLVAVSALGVAHAQQVDLPVFEVDPSWPTIPNDWVLGQVASVVVDGRDHIWVLHRPRTVPDAAQANAAPPVLVFDTAGAFIRAWGGPGDGFDWPANEHGIHVDHEGHVWIGGNGGDPSDDMLLKFTSEGELVLQVGGRARSQGNRDTQNLQRPAESFVHPETNEVFVADGYGNRRVVVLDAETGAFKRMWGAFGSEPRDAVPAAERTGADAVANAVTNAGSRGDGPGPHQLGTVHGIEVSRDGRVYVADRDNSRLQIFTLAGAYLTQAFINTDEGSALTAAGLAFSGDPEQMFIYVADQGSSHIHVVDRETLDVIDTIGTSGEGPGEFRALHHIATDSKGSIYTAEAQRGQRVQRFRFVGMASWLE